MSTAVPVDVIERLCARGQPPIDARRLEAFRVFRRALEEIEQQDQTGDE